MVWAARCSSCPVSTSSNSGFCFLGAVTHKFCCCHLRFTCGVLTLEGPQDTRATLESGAGPRPCVLGSGCAYLPLSWQSLWCLSPGLVLARPVLAPRCLSPWPGCRDSWLSMTSPKLSHACDNKCANCRGSNCLSCVPSALSCHDWRSIGPGLSRRWLWGAVLACLLSSEHSLPSRYLICKYLFLTLPGCSC